MTRQLEHSRLHQRCLTSDIRELATLWVTFLRTTPSSSSSSSNAAGQGGPGGSPPIWRQESSRCYASPCSASESTSAHQHQQRCAPPSHIQHRRSAGNCNGSSGQHATAFRETGENPGVAEPPTAQCAPDPTHLHLQHEARNQYVARAAGTAEHQRIVSAACRREGVQIAPGPQICGSAWETYT